MKMLLVEDDKQLAHMYATRFANEGWGTVICHDGSDALYRVRGERFDAIVLDIMLPGISGIDVLQLLRQEDKTVSTPIIMYTNYGDDGNREKCLTYGADEFVLKVNETPENLVQTINRVVSLKSVTELSG